MIKEINGIQVEVTGSIIPEDEELAAYLERGRKLYQGRLKGIRLSVPEDEPGAVDIEYSLKQPGFHRLRRITGYLVGSLDRWNDGKRAEELDRVKHGV